VRAKIGYCRISSRLGLPASALLSEHEAASLLR
jgi:hypothetical protein